MDRPLHFAAMLGAAEIAEMLLAAGDAREMCEMRDEDGRLPSELAAAEGCVTLARRLAPLSSRET